MAQDGGGTATPVSPRRRQILDAAAPLFAAHGVAATSVRDIATAADLKSGSLYHQFAAKEEIAGELVAAYVAELGTAYDAELAGARTGADRVVGLIRASLRVMHRHPHASQIYERDAALLRAAGTPAGLREITNGLQEAWLASLRAGMADGSVRAGLDVRVAFRLIRDGLWLTVRWYQPSQVYPLERLEEECIALYLAGIRA
ncbi:TetR/AcrR family transcriptional regulator [Nocardioides nitrophenolicus]|uniref:TetR/AcrR family transcriptional regulator n=1 Tax=Nocardioides nitrophenolicus TaxID=60489 RepID=UPI00195AEA28|nr:TetR family transcriptional regulator [Nocardioides nitrophenolicus]MBM7517678.1 AcrR family transcriptional regulator [Nocardioides nitrophenolicus]